MNNFQYLLLSGIIKNIFYTCKEKSYLYFIEFESSHQTYVINVPMFSSLLEIIYPSKNIINIKVAKCTTKYSSRFKLIDIINKQGLLNDKNKSI
ncbi:MAG: hypothetical protein ACRCVW_00045 [Brevinema sp.]